VMQLQSIAEDICCEANVRDVLPYHPGPEAAQGEPGMEQCSMLERYLKSGTRMFGVPDYDSYDDAFVRPEGLASSEVHQPVWTETNTTG